MTQSLALLLLWGAIAPPRVGYVRDEGNRVRPVIGIAANFILGPPIALDVLSAAFSRSAGLIKTDHGLEVIAGSKRYFPAPSGEALFAFAADGSPELVYFSKTRDLLRWHAGGLKRIALDAQAVDGEVISVSSGIALLVKRQDRIWRLEVDATSGAVRSGRVLAGASAPALLRPDGTVLYLDSGDVVIEQRDGSRQRVHEPRASHFEEMGDEWVSLGGRLVLRLAEKSPRIYQLPGPAK